MFQAMKYKKRIQDKDTTLYGHIDMTKFQKVGHEYNIDTAKFMCTYIYTTYRYEYTIQIQTGMRIYRGMAIIKYVYINSHYL